MERVSGDVPETRTNAVGSVGRELGAKNQTRVNKSQVAEGHQKSLFRQTGHREG
ncbi:MAG: hypothetical protein ACI8T1_001116 [Verrucomicrobiales bacterium]|jgi:hypothetical protein